MKRLGQGSKREGSLSIESMSLESRSMLSKFFCQNEILIPYLPREMFTAELVWSVFTDVLFFAVGFFQAELESFVFYSALEPVSVIKGSVPVGVRIPSQPQL